MKKVATHSVTLRLTSAEMARLEEIADGLGLTKSEVLRRALHQLDARETAIDEMRQIKVELEESIKVSEDRIIKRNVFFLSQSVKLLMFVLKAPVEAKDAFNKIFDGN